ncbi:MAG: hypothetical protein WB764_23915 [Xanthobacteraceae bacterium]
MEKELAGLDLEAILTAEVPFEGMSDVEKLADLDQYGLAMLLDLLRPVIGGRTAAGRRSRSPKIWPKPDTYGVDRGEKQRSRLNELIEDVATC